MAEEKEAKSTVARIEISLDQETGKFDVKSNTQARVILFGMLEMAKGGLFAPKPSPIVKPTLAERIGLKKS